MGWISNDSLHEAYLEAVLLDGTTTSTSNAMGPIVMVDDEAGNYTGADEQRSNDEVVGWRLRCNCSTPTSFSPVSKWVGDSWQRVATAALEDVDAGRIFVSNDWDASSICDREDVETVARARWLSDHVSPLEALETIRTAKAEIAAATARLNQAVSYARATGQTWQTIGQAAGTSRQSAQERWGHAQD